jgi:hypothetical protein
MTITTFYRVCGVPVLALGAAFFFSACELEIGDEQSASSSSDNAPPTGNTGKNNTGGGNQNPDTDEPTDGTAAPGAPTLLSPGNNETVSGSVTLVWTDAEGAVEFELAIQGLGSGGWQAADSTQTDDFKFIYSINPAWTQYRWAVRSIGADGQKSGFTAWRSFSGTP